MGRSSQRESVIEKNAPKRIVCVITRSDTLGGAQIHLCDIAVWLRENGYDVTVVVGGHGPYTELLNRKEVKWVSSGYLKRAIRPWRDFAAYVEVRRLLKSLRPDVIALHSAKAGLLGRLAAARLGVPVVFTAHGWSFTEGVSPLAALCFRCLERVAAPLADRIITVSDYDRNLGLNAGVGSSRSLVTVHNGLPESTLLASAGSNSESVKVISVARLDWPKNHHLLLDALAELSDLDWKLELVGDGPLEDELRQHAVDLAIDDRVSFLGLREDVAELLCNAHVFVLATEFEGFPLTTLEAMRAGLPVVVSDVGGAAEALAHGETGYAVPRADKAALRNSLRPLIESGDLRHRFGRAGRARFEERYTLTKMAEATDAIYRELIEEYQCESW